MGRLLVHNDSNSVIHSNMRGSVIKLYWHYKPNRLVQSGKTEIVKNENMCQFPQCMSIIYFGVYCALDPVRSYLILRARDDLGYGSPRKTAILCRLIPDP